MTWMELALAALGAWGWAGMKLTVEVTNPGDAYAAKAHVDATFQTCRIEVNVSIPEDSIYADDVMLHEVGHCVGYWGLSWGDHSADSGSIMYASIGGQVQRILSADLLAAKAKRDARLTYRTYLPGVAR